MEFPILSGVEAERRAKCLRRGVAAAVLTMFILVPAGLVATVVGGLISSQIALWVGVSCMCVGTMTWGVASLLRHWSVEQRLVSRPPQPDPPESSPHSRPDQELPPAYSQIYPGPSPSSPSPQHRAQEEPPPSYHSIQTQLEQLDGQLQPNLSHHQSQSERLYHQSQSGQLHHQSQPGQPQYQLQSDQVHNQSQPEQLSHQSQSEQPHPQLQFDQPHQSSHPGQTQISEPHQQQSRETPRLNQPSPPQFDPSPPPPLTIGQGSSQSPPFTPSRSQLRQEVILGVQYGLARFRPAPISSSISSLHSDPRHSGSSPNTRDMCIKL